MDVTRRNFLATTAALASIGPSHATPADLDVAIIGGGVCGAYAAWRLRQAKPHLRIQLFEMSGRIGGRLRSIAFPQAPHLVGEAGGMRFLTAQPHISHLVQHLKLKTRGFPVQEPRDRLDLRGVSPSHAEIDAGEARYLRNVPKEGPGPHSKLFIQTISKIVPDAATMAPAHWRTIRKTLRYRGRLLKDWASWELMANVMSSAEARNVSARNGYNDIMLYQNGLESFDNVFLNPCKADASLTLAAGYEHLPQVLAHEAARHGAGIVMQARLESVRHSGLASAPFGLTFRARDGRQTVVTARKLVLAMPRRALERIGDFPVRREPKFKALIESVNSVPASKAGLLYAKPWWVKDGIRGGGSVSDMPARQFHALEGARGHGVLMMHNDSAAVEYWRTLVAQPKPDAQGFQWLSGDSEFAQAVNREAALTYAMKTPAPIAAFYQDWTADPYGGGWHFWSRGEDGLSLAARMVKPLGGEDLYVCGEAYAPTGHGWVEGALVTAERVLQGHFGLGVPHWLA